MGNNKEQWGSSIGFIMAAVGSAVGLGNIWGFPYKMGANGGFAFLIIYLLLAIFVGFVIMFGELLIGRYTGKGVIQAYNTLNKKYTVLGWLGFISPMLILGFYSSLGGYCIYFSLANLADVFGLSWGVGGQSGADFFSAFYTDPVLSCIFGAVFVILTGLIVIRGISSGIEKFTSIAMPVLFIMLVIVIIRSVTLPGAEEGLKFILSPNFEPLKENFMGVLASAGGQMFFSLSLGMGIMVTYGAYLKKEQNVQANSLIVVFSDTLIAVMAAFAVMPAVFATGLEPAGGPGLLFMTLQNVFNAMGGFGPLFGFIFYFLVFIAAITSSISLLNVGTEAYMDSRVSKGKTPNRVTTTVGFATFVLIMCTLVNIDALGDGPFPKFMGFILLDFLDLWSEGIFMPLGALCMSLIVGWKLGPKWIKAEQEKSGHPWKAAGFMLLCFRIIAPLGVFLVLLGQLDTFFGLDLFS